MEVIMTDEAADAAIHDAIEDEWPSIEEFIYRRLPKVSRYELRSKEKPQTYASLMEEEQRKTAAKAPEAKLRECEDLDIECAELCDEILQIERKVANYPRLSNKNAYWRSTGPFRTDKQDKTVDGLKGMKKELRLKLNRLYRLSFWNHYDMKFCDLRHMNNAINHVYH